MEEQGGFESLRAEAVETLKALDESSQHIQKTTTNLFFGLLDNIQSNIGKCRTASVYSYIIMCVAIYSLLVCIL